MPDTEAQEKYSGAESPTTAGQLDFDDEPLDTSGPKSPTKPDMSASDTKVETAPEKPPRPLSARQQAENTLIEAFPDIDASVVKAVLTASGGQVEPAFNALLGMSDPNFKAEEAPPPQPPRPTAAQRQLEQDEAYARHLAQQYQGQIPPRGTSAQQPRANTQRPRPEDDRELYSDDDRDRNFFDDDLQEFGENVRKGFVQTQAKFNKWIGDFTKKIGGDEDDPYDGPTRQSPPPRRQNFGPSQSEQLYGIQKSADRSRRSGDAERYDADPHVLGDDFTSLELRDEETPPPKPSRPTANPDLFKPHPAPPQSGPVDEVDAAERRQTAQGDNAPGSSTKSAKWQPLTSVVPNPEPEEDDPFSLGDSDDEKESKTKDLREADSARLKEAARKSVSSAGGEKPVLQESERGSIGTKDKVAEELLKGDK